MSNQVTDTDQTTVTTVEQSETKPVKAAAKRATSVPRTDTKKAKAVSIASASIAAGHQRKETIAKLQAEIGLSSAGANTYYQNVKAKKAGWV